VLDLRRLALEEPLSIAEAALGCQVDAEHAVYGWRGKSVGFPTVDGSAWIRLTNRPLDRINERTWTGDECASVLSGVSKPELLRSYRWTDVGLQIVWKADEMTIVGDPPIAPDPYVVIAPRLGEDWWAVLTASLESLALSKTGRVAVRQDLISRRISEVSGRRVDPAVDEWRPAHGDLHWANLAAPRCVILDWEGWGSGPRGYDAALLWAFSLGVSSLADEILGRFREDFATRTGTLARLFVCSELLHMVGTYGDHPFLEGPLKLASDDLIRQLSS
jgi:hypothetical protein